MARRITAWEAFWRHLLRQYQVLAAEFPPPVDAVKDNRDGA